MSHLEVFEEYRSYLFSIAYRMVGSVMEAEDIVQEAYLRWQKADEDQIDSPKAYLATIVTRLCLDHLKSARVKREQYIGPWLPEPLVSDISHGPAQQVAMSESLTMAFMVLLESLKPQERAVYLLREVFDYQYAEIAEMVDKSEAACRQMVSRARRYIESRRPKYDVSREQSERAVRQFMQAIYAGDMDGLMEVLEAEAVWISDGGGLRGVARKPIEGADNVARFVLALLENAPADLQTDLTTVNGEPGLMIRVDQEPYAVLAFEVIEDKINAIRAVVNPDKLISTAIND